MNLRDTAACLGWVAAFLSCAMWLPVAGPILGLLTPVPFFYYAFRAGASQGALMVALVVLAVGIVGSMTGFAKMGLLAAEYGVLGYVLTRLLTRERSLAEIVATASILLAVTGGLIILLMSVVKGFNIIEAVRAYLAEEFKQAATAYRQSGLMEMQGEDLDELVKTFVEIFSRLLPSLMLVGTVLVVWINTLVVRSLARIRGLAVAAQPPAGLWQVPEQLVWVFIPAGFLSFFSGGLLQWAAVNVLIVLGMVYLFGGVCIVVFFLGKHKAPPWLRFAVYGLIAVQQLFLLVLALAGLFDQWADFRKIHRRAQ